MGRFQSSVDRRFRFLFRLTFDLGSTEELVFEVILGTGQRDLRAAPALRLQTELLGRTMNPHTVRCIAWIRTLLPLLWFALSVTAHPQAPQASTEEQTRATQNAKKNASTGKSATKKSSILQFNTSGGSVVVSPRAVELSGQSASSTESSPQQNADLNVGRKGEIVVAPFPISNPAIGSGIVLVGGYLFPLSKKEDASPNSMIGGGSFYTSSGS